MNQTTVNPGFMEPWPVWNVLPQQQEPQPQQQAQPSFEDFERVIEKQTRVSFYSGFSMGLLVGGILVCTATVFILRR
jgi:hypothetical protein